MFNHWVQIGLRRLVSDHCAISVTAAVLDWGLKPFHVIDAWLEHPGFIDLIKEQWSSYQVDGWAAFRCKTKLQRLKQWLREWNKNVFGDINRSIEEAAKRVKDIDL